MARYLTLKIGDGGATPYQRVRGWPFSQGLVAFGEKVLAQQDAKGPEAQNRGKFCPRWSQGVVLVRARAFTGTGSKRARGWTYTTASSVGRPRGSAARISSSTLLLQERRSTNPEVHERCRSFL